MTCIWLVLNAVLESNAIDIAVLSSILETKEVKVRDWQKDLD